MKRAIVVMMLLLISSSMIFAQESGMPTQSGTQEPEVPGDPPPAPGQPPSDPDSVYVPQKSGSQKQDRLQMPEKDKCAPGQDAKECVEQQRDRK
ncbi:hypothetical protein WH297_19330 [Ochrobactrum vermis]|uniref:Uncharacterized protein n=1 Tax=Ochrobactrum vermis TaxID=1827297 RepID=A0ABU8PHY7_9HYPH|nr:hypothetical protein [Ochrobactrum vermis]PQZ26182.1 hypothetical protein CQZ93_19640 [Ochrobactrum vermis]